ncbi:Amuc_1099 family pilus-like system protein [Luteolibacter sp. Populi]|uniref:Amuc_1099 family pilus-like system protein n=1 Tax=Luteolibacter sp. Populi TaxID=3230487 RepID=UPI00346711CA
MNPSEDPSDRLVDSLLRQQARGAADEALLQAIGEKLDAATPIPARSPRRGPIWASLAAAAAVVCVGTGTYLWQRENEPAPGESSLALGVGEAAMNRTRRSLPDSEMPPAPPLPGPIEAPPASDGKIASSAAVSGPIASAEAQNAAPAGRLEIPPSAVPMEPAAPLPSEALAHNMERRRGSAGGKGAGEGIGFGGAATADPFGSDAIPAPRMAREQMAEVAKSKAPASGRANLLPEEAPAARDGSRPAVDDGQSRDNYGQLVDQPWKSPWQDALSTFSIDVDTASYTNLRRMIMEGRPVPPDAVRIEECVNYFDYKYAGPQGDGPFAVHGNLATCPWKPGHLLARVAIKGKEIPNNARPASNLVFLIDVSGSMQSPDKLTLLKRSMRVLIDQLDERDRVGMVVYAGTEGVVLDPTVLDERGKSAAIQALEKLEAGGSTNGGAGIKRAYELATKNRIQGGTNRVILATDGDFNVGTTGQGDLVDLVKKGAGGGVSLSVLGFGTGNLNDAMMEAIAKDGDGNYYYVDSDEEARRVFLQKLTGTLVTIAKDVKIQVEFNPGKVQAYRLIGYADRILRHEDFNDDKVDAGDIGAGHTVTAFYEIVPEGVAMPNTGTVDSLRYQRPAGKEVVASDDWFTLKLRHKHPEGDTSALIETTVKGEPGAWEDAGNDFRFASAVALFGMKLRQMPELADLPWSTIESIAKPALAEDPQEQRAGFIGMLRKIGKYDPAVVTTTVKESDAAGIPAPLRELRYLGVKERQWYLAFGLEPEGRWAPKLIGLNSDKTSFSNRVSATAPLAPGDVFFKDGEMAGRFRFIGFTEKEITSKRTNLTQKVRVAIYEDLSPSKAGTRYESQYGVPDSEIAANANFNRVAMFRLPGGSILVVGERTRFTPSADGTGPQYFLKEVSPREASVEYTDTQGILRTLTIPAVSPAEQK